MKKLLAAALVLAMVFLLTGCILVDVVNNAKDVCRPMVDAIISGDSEAAWALIGNNADRSEFDAAFAQAHADMADIGEYKLSLNKVQSTTYPEYSVTSASGKLKCEAGTFRIRFDYNSVNGMRFFSITQGKIEAEVDIEKGGLFYTAADAEELQTNAFDIAGIVLWLLVVALCILLIWDCVRQPIQNKWVWILLMLLVSVTFNLPIGDNAVSVTLPIGEIIYLCNRKKLIAKGRAVLNSENPK